MKLATFKTKDVVSPRYGFKRGDHIVDVLYLSKFLQEENDDTRYLNLPLSLKEALKNWDQNLRNFKMLDEELSYENLKAKTKGGFRIAQSISDIQLLAPIPNPNSFRDFYAFEQHVRSARKLRGLDMHPDWFKIPIFYFSNATAIYGHGAPIAYPKMTQELDFELEFAIIIANGGSNINHKDGDNYIAGYTICNDWSARDLQREEMAMSLGPAKGKDFATSFGPFLVTPDELQNKWDENGKLHLRMTCHVNGNLISDGNTNDLFHPFTKMIERASLNTKLMPGDYLGSGTVGTGCILELRPENTGGWLKKGDTVKLEVEDLGVLENTIV